MSNNITSGSNLIVSNDATIGGNIYSNTGTITTFNSNSSNISDLTATNADINNLNAQNINLNGVDIQTILSSNILIN